MAGANSPESFGIGSLPQGLLAGALVLRPNFLGAVLASFQNGELAVFILRELELSGPRLGKEFRIRLRKHRQRPAIVELDEQMIAFGNHLQAVMRKLVRPRIPRQ